MTANAFATGTCITLSVRILHFDLGRMKFYRDRSDEKNHTHKESPSRRKLGEALFIK